MMGGPTRLEGTATMAGIELSARERTVILAALGWAHSHIAGADDELEALIDRIAAVTPALAAPTGEEEELRIEAEIIQAAGTGSADWTAPKNLQDEGN